MLADIDDLGKVRWRILQRTEPAIIEDRLSCGSFAGDQRLTHIAGRRSIK